MRDAKMQRLMMLLPVHGRTAADITFLAQASDLQRRLYNRWQTNPANSGITAASALDHDLEQP